MKIFLVDRKVTFVSPKNRPFVKKAQAKINHINDGLGFLAFSNKVPIPTKRSILS